MDYENLPGGNGGASAVTDGDQFGLLPEIAAAAAAAARTGGVPLLPDANGVVVLPAGATLDDIAVVGRDLVITLDNGQVFVIPEGAIYVPQIVIDGVAVPPLNLAALLIGEEPIEPAAGLARSSGNNFFEPAGPIQQSFAIGDLLPPTDFSLATPTDDEEELQLLDSDPTLVIVTPNAPGGGIAVSATVAESGLPARGGEPAGSNAAATTEATGGTIVFTSPDGIDSLTINGVAITATGQTIVSPRGTLTITSIDLANGTIGFTYTLTDNLVGGTLADLFTVVLTDADGDTATSTLTVNVTDDAPTARNDTDALAARTFTAELGNVITGAGTTSGAAGADTQGADGAAITRIASNAIPANADTSFDGAGNLQVAGQYGTLLIRADGSYGYTRAAGTPGGVSDAFTYTLTDADGSASTATLTIAIADAAPGAITTLGSGAPGAVVAESGLPARNGEPAGSNAAANTETTSGTITFNPGDGPATVTINGTTIAVGTVIATPSGTLTVTAFDPNAGTIGYTFTLADNVPGDPANVSFAIVVTDADGDSANGTLTIAIADDAPLAVADSATQAAENAAVTVSVLANDTQGADGVAASAVATVPGTLTGAGTLVVNPNGTITYTPAAGEQGMVTFDYTITDGDGDVSRATVTITLVADSTPTIGFAGDAGVAEAGLPARGGEPAGSNAASADETAAGTIALGTGGDTLASLVINGVNVTTGGTVTTAKGMLTVTVAGGAYSYSYTLADNTLADPDSDTFTVVATDSDGDAATGSLVIAIADDAPSAVNDAGSVAAGTFGPIAGNVLTNDVRGADGAVVQSYSGVTAGNAGAAIQGQYGTLTIQADGSYSYVRNAGTPGGVSDSFAYTIRDGDGDTATANLVIAIADSGATLTIPPAGTAGSTQVLEAGLPTGSAAAGNGEFASGSFSFTAPDGPATVTINGVAVTAVGQTIAGSFGTLTITSIAAGSIGYSYQLTAPTSGDATSETFTVVVTDQDGDAASGSLAIAIVDDAPLAVADSATQAPENGTVTVNVLANDTRGADGVANSAVAPVAGTLTGTGTLVYNNDGTFTYTPGVGEQGTVSFDYTITDGDGDVSRATVTIALLADSTPTISFAGDASVDEAALPARGAEPAGSNAASPDETAVGTIAVATGGDTLASLVINGTDVTNGGTVTTAKGILTVTVAAGTYSYSYTLSDNTLADPDSDTFAVVATDSDGDSASSNLVIAIVDDAPTANADVDSVREDGPTVATGNVINGIDTTVAPDANATDGVADVRGADGASIVSVTYNGVTGGPGVFGTLYGSMAIQPNGTYRYTLNNNNPLVQGLDSDDTLTETFTYTIRDGDGDLASTTLTITIQGSDDGVTINGLNVPFGELGFNESNLPDGSSPNAAALTQSNSFTVAGADGVATIVVGGQTVFQNGAFVPGQTVVTATGVLTITNVVPVKDAAGDTVSATVSYSYTLTDNTLAHTGANDPNFFDVFAVTVTDSDGSTAAGTIDILIRDDAPQAQFDSDSVAEDGVLVADGNVLTGVGGSDANATDGVADIQGADGVVVTAVGRFDGVVLTPGTLGAPLAGLYGTVTLNADGSYVYTLDNTNAAVQGLDGDDTLNESFTYTITDGDGDTSTANLVITIRGANDAVTITGLNVAGGEETVLEANLADGSAPNAGALTQTGSFTLAGVDGLASATIGGFPVFQGGAAGLPPPIFTAFGTLTFTSASQVTDASGQTVSITYNYSYQLTDNTLNHSGANADQLIVSVPVTVTDSDGSTASDTLDIVVVDDTPTARADSDSIGEDSATPATGNVITGQDQGGLPDANATDGVADTPGADGATVTAVAFNPIGGGSAAGTVNGQTAGQYGTLSLGANGAYQYTVNAASAAVQGLDDGETLTETFSYTITDGDGDTATATLTITINGANDAPVVGTAIARVSEEGLAGGIADAAGNVDTTDFATVTGAIPISDPDGEATTVAFGDPGAVLTADGQPVTWSGIGTGLLIGSVGAVEVIRIAIDGTGAYTVTLSQSVDHVSAGQEDDLNFLVPVSVSDGTASVPTTLQIYIEDDSPIAVADGRTTTEGAAALTGNVLANDQTGADTPAAVTLVNGAAAGSAIAGTYGTLTLNADGSYSYTPNASVPSGSVDSFTYTMRDADGDTSTATLSFTFEGDVNAPTAGTTTATVDEDALAGGNPGGVGDDDGTAQFSGVLPNSFGLDGPGRVTFAQLDGQSATFGTETVQLAWNEGASTLTGTGPRGALFTVTVDQANGAYTFTLLDNVLHAAGGDENNATNLALAYRVIDSDGSIATGTLAVDADDDTPTIAVTTGDDSGVVLTTRDAATIGAANDVATSAAQFGGAVTLAVSAGADGAAGAPALSYGLTIANSASGLTSGGAAISLAQLGDGTVVGYTGGAVPGSEIAAQVVFSVKVAADGAVTLTQFQQIDHASEFPNTSAPFDDQFATLGDGRIALTVTATVTDGDGDAASGTTTIDLGGNIRFADDGPSLGNVVAGAGVTLDETSAGNVFGAGPISATSAGAAITATSAFGADGPAALATSYALAIDGGGATALRTAIGDFAITLVQVNDQTIAGRYDNGAIQTAFTLTIGGDGRVTVTQNVALEHNLDGAANPGPGDPHDDPLSLAGLVTARITITDRDGDTATGSATIGDGIVFRDDGPTIDVSAGPAAGVLLTTRDAATIGAASDLATSTAQFGGTFLVAAAPGADGGAPTVSYALGLTGSASGLTSRGAAISLVRLGDGTVLGYTGAVTPGSENAATVVFSVKVAADGAVTLTQFQQVDHPSAADPTPGSAPFDDQFASLADGLITLTATAAITDNDGDTASDSATISIGANLRFADTGPTALTITANGATDDEDKGAFAALSVEGGTGDVAGSPATLTGEAGSLFAAGADGLGAITVTGPGGLRAIHDTNGDGKADQEAVNYVAVTAGDGAVTYRGVGAVSGQTVFTLQVNADGSYSFTQARALVHSGAADDNLAVTFAVSVRDFDGDTATGSLTVTVNDDSPSTQLLVAAVTTDDEGKGPFTGIEGGDGDVAGSPAVASAGAGSLFKPGADGFGSLQLIGPPGVKAIYQGTASGNIGSGQQEDVVYTRVTAANGSVTLTGRGAVTGAVVFVLVVGNDGSYTFTQSRALVQLGNNESDLGLAFTYTLTDGDGDTKTGLLTVNVDDDTPIAFTPVAASALNTGTAVVSGDLDTVGNGVFDNSGADGIQSLTFAAAINGTKLTGAGGTALTSGGQDIFLYIQGNGTLIASTDATPATLDPALTVFTASLSAVTGRYTIDFDRTIDNGSGTQVADFRATKAGNNQWNGADPDLVNGAAIDIAAANDPNRDSTDLLFTPSTGGTINTSATDLGVSNQFVDANETVRIDLVQDLRRDAGLDESTAGGYLYDTHVGVSQATFRILQVQGNGTVSVRISASNVDDANPLSQSAVGTAAINTAVNLNHATVEVRNAAGVLQTDVTIYNAGNDVVIAGLEAGDRVSFGAEANVTFESFTIDNAAGDPVPGGVGNLGGRPFGVGGFAYSAVALGSPVQFTLPVVLTDGDGDTSAGSIAVTVNPVVPVALDLDGDGVEFVGLSAGAAFDYNGDGTAAATSWVGGDDGILVLDANGNRTADGAGEIVFGGNGLTDLEGLAASHDGNNDGVLSAADADFAKFGVWQDANGNGVTDAGEFHTLGELGIVSIGLVSDKQGYAAANGEVQVAGTAAYTRADGSTGAVADAAFTAAPLERMAARAAEAAAGNAAAAGYLAAAALAASTLPAAASEPAPVTAPTLPTGGDTLQPAADTHVERHVEPADLVAGVAAKPAPLAPTANHAEPAAASALAEAVDRGGDAVAADHAPAAAVSAAPAPVFADADGGQLMEALLLAAQAPSAGSQHPQDVAAVLEAFGDSHGAALVDAVVDHFAGADSALPLGSGGSEVLAGLLAGTVSGTEGFAGGFDLTGLLDDHGATAAAQV